ncbi:hypothetical protein FDF15_06240 [Clostridium botulinum]|uniref:hypothetical protein n=1 Tax=Clostridium botulinum TaxID=1491 RepID=UPI00077465C0|nr:hypothetical protein [Clostridium botulinum]AUM99368.1 hypothetical protein RSJ13_10245 [Clostridium botulinum]KEI81298.1 hypothetical protein N487_10505 [Clostridium botulinum B2 331]MBN3409306.1 hypothetical protein [Clostridium botulinum]MBY6795664.1 hypothetical protein [Clostridium botulinum]MBY6865405.1 hypothetical protein [Clostridium botulinum]
MNKVMNLKTKDFFENGCCGILWILVGIAELLKFNANIISASVFGILTIDTIFMLIPQFFKTEIEDEMAEYNKKRAASNAFIIIYTCILFATVFGVGSGGLIVDLELILPFLVGGMSLLRFGFFLFYEKVGD